MNENNSIASVLGNKPDTGNQDVALKSPQPSAVRLQRRPVDNDAAGDRAEGERLQALLDAAFPPADDSHKASREVLFAWRSERGGRIVSCNLNDCVFEPAPGLRLPAGRSATIYRGSDPKDVLKRAAVLDRLCIDVKARKRGIPDDEALALKRVVQTAYASSKKRAAKFGIPHTIALPKVEEILWDQKCRCAVSGIQFSAEARGEGGYRAPFRPSLDRIVNAKGYVPGNVRLVLTIVNLAMNDWGEVPLIQVAMAISKRVKVVQPQATELST